MDEKKREYRKGRGYLHEFRLTFRLWSEENPELIEALERASEDTGTSMAKTMIALAYHGMDGVESQNTEEDVQADDLLAMM